MPSDLLDSWRRWLSNTSNFLHISVLLIVPLLTIIVVELSAVTKISYLLFPPLASATYTVFSDPEGKYSETRRIIGGLTIGSLMGWMSFEFGDLVLESLNILGVRSFSAALAVFLTGIVTWFNDTEHPSGYSAALLAVFLEVNSLLYVLSVFLSSLLIGIFFSAWKTNFYETRSEYLYESTWSDDRVILPIRKDVDDVIVEEKAEAGITDFAARIAGAHEGGRVVLLEMTEDESVISNAKRLEEIAEVLEARHGTNVEVSILETELEYGEAVLNAAERYSCDIIVAPWEEEKEESEDRNGTEERGDGDEEKERKVGEGERKREKNINGSHLSNYVRTLFEGDRDVVVFKGHSTGPWRETLVPVRSSGELSRLMVDLASRIVNGGTVSVSKIISRRDNRREAERELFDLVNGFSGRFETRVKHIDTKDSSIEDFIARASTEYDLMFLGASTDRTPASRFVSRPMFEKVIHKVDVPVALVHSESASGEIHLWVPLATPVIKKFKGVKEKIDQSFG